MAQIVNNKFRNFKFSGFRDETIEKNKRGPYDAFLEIRFATDHLRIFKTTRECSTLDQWKNIEKFAFPSNKIDKKQEEI